MLGSYIYDCKLKLAPYQQKSIVLLLPGSGMEDFDFVQFPNVIKCHHGDFELLRCPDVGLLLGWIGKNDARFMNPESNDLCHLSLRRIKGQKNAQHKTLHKMAVSLRRSWTRVLMGSKDFSRLLALLAQSNPVPSPARILMTCSSSLHLTAAKSGQSQVRATTLTREGLRAAAVIWWRTVKGLHPRHRWYPLMVFPEDLTKVAQKEGLLWFLNKVDTKWRERKLLICLEFKHNRPQL